MICINIKEKVNSKNKSLQQISNKTIIQTTFSQACQNKQKSIDQVEIITVANSKMKKFKKPLTINIIQDQPHLSQSPITKKDIKSRPLLLYNEHTIASSINNEDQEREKSEDEEFVESRVSRDEDGEDCNIKGKARKFHVIQFQEFTGQEDVAKANEQGKNQLASKFYQKQHANQRKDIQLQGSKAYRKAFSIEIPQQKKDQPVSFAFQLRPQNPKNAQKSPSIPRQPPAPSNRSKPSHLKQSNFIFPNSLSPAQVIPISHQSHKKSLQNHYEQKINQLKLNFQKERKQFYSEKQSLEKDLMIKDGQIQMLQKLITSRYSPTETNRTFNFQYFHEKDKEQARESHNHIHNTHNANSTNNRLISSSILRDSDQKINTLQSILLEKDLQINQLLAKIHELNCVVESKDTQIQEINMSLLKLKKQNQSLKGQLYILTRKQASQSLSKQFYQIKQSLVCPSPKAHPKAHIPSSINKTLKPTSHPKWQQQLPSHSKQKPSQSYPMRGIDDLHKRLESLKLNRIELENRGKIKSEIGYAQTSKHKAKGAFDFNGKYYHQQAAFHDHSRLY